MADRTSPAAARAMLVEDELLVAIHVEELLEEIGYQQVVTAARVADALDRLASTPDIAVVVLDVNLAGEQSWPVARECRRRGIPWVFVTGYLKGHASLPDDLASSETLTKPVDRESLAAGLARAEAATRR